jgi:hypothetical protein
MASICEVGVPDRGVVDDGQQFGQVVQQHPVVQHLVAIVQLFHVHVLGEVVTLRLQLPPGPPGLLLQGQHPGRQPPGQAQRVPLGRRERHPAVAQRVVQDGRLGRRAQAAVVRDVLVHLTILPMSSTRGRR